MTDKRYDLRFHGVRGSRCVSGEKFVRYGGNTTSLSVQLSNDRWLVLDCGTGLCTATFQPSSGSGDGPTFEILLTHYHPDHIAGLCFFEPLYDPSCRLTIRGFPYEGMGVQEILERVICPPWFPIPIASTASTKTYIDLTDAPLAFDGLDIRTARLHHPQGVTAYRLEHAHGSLVFATDTEHGDVENDAKLVSLAHGADVLIHDAQYSPDEFERYRGRGHSTWQHAVKVARDSGAAQLILFHHDPERSDGDIDAIEELAGGGFPNVRAAYEGMSVSF